MSKTLTNEERAWLREHAYHYESPHANGIEGLARVVGYPHRQGLSRVLNEEGRGMGPGYWRRLMQYLVERPTVCEDFEIEAASPETRRELRRARERAARRERWADGSPSEGVTVGVA